MTGSTQAHQDPLSVSLSKLVARVNFDDLPEEVIKTTKKSILDTLAVSWAATEHADVAQLVPFVVNFAAGEDSTVWAVGGKAPAGYAALANGILAAALDFDSLQGDALVHADICVLPAAFAIAERQGSSGKELLAAAALGTEMASRLGLSAQGHTGWFYTSIFGCFGAAVAAAKLLGLGEDGIRDAISIVMSRVAGTQQPNIERASTKRMQSAFAAQAGVEAALLASAGLRGPVGAIDGKFGLFSMYEHGVSEIVLDGFGENYLITRTSFKEYPCCACSHAAIEATLALVENEQFKADEISKINVSITPYMYRLVGEPFDPSENPTVSGQFSVRYAVAAVLLRGEFGVADILPEMVTAPDVGSLANLVDVTTYTDETGRLTPAEVSVTLQDGKTHSRRIDCVTGSPKTPLSDAKFENKIAKCISRGHFALSSDQHSRMMQMIATLESLDNVQALFPRILQGDKAYEIAG